MKLFRLILLALGIFGKNAEEENGDGKVTHNASDVQKLNELRRAILDAQVHFLFFLIYFIKIYSDIYEFSCLLSKQGEFVLSINFISHIIY